MSNIEENLEIWLQKTLLPELKISLKKTNSVVKHTVSVPSDPFFMSRVFLLDLQFFSEDEKIEEEVNLVVKRPPLGKKGRNVFDLDAAFHNEILFYTKFAKFSNDFPKLFYALEKPSYDSIIVTENINYRGYYLNSEKTNLDIKYILAAMREIAKFHANGYIMKYKNPEKFLELVKGIKKCRKSREESSFTDKKTKASVPRIIKYLQKQNYDKIFCKKLEKFLLDGFVYAVEKLGKPIEPLATLCHGDFLRNNVFFKKSNDSIKTKLIDFGLLNYGSPCQDIAHFLYLSGTRSHRTDQFPEIFDVYYKSLLEHLKKGGLENLENFSREAFLENYKMNAFFGYSISVVFLPAMLGLFGENPTRLLFMPEDEACQMYAEVGGDEYTKILVQMIFDLREAGCLDFVDDIVIE